MSVREELRNVRLAMLELREIIRERLYDRFVVNNGCAVCNGRGWITNEHSKGFELVFDDNFNRGVKYCGKFITDEEALTMGYEQCTNVECTQETRATSGINPHCGKVHDRVVHDIIHGIEDLVYETAEWKILSNGLLDEETRLLDDEANELYIRLHM